MVRGDLRAAVVQAAFEQTLGPRAGGRRVRGGVGSRKEGDHAVLADRAAEEMALEGPTLARGLGVVQVAFQGLAIRMPIVHRISTSLLQPHEL